ncbi:MAG: hypothetical protein PUI85_04185 [Eubacteriales bacterium]|nr:hypothetical protein [Eubacteriales bacterium]MDY3332357.1 hypothetical protein [Gallibacter sp.]
MKTFSLVGKSGTGKSYQALNLCHNLNIESIIDDGLFIFRGKAIAGKSAKKDATKMGAIKTAIFSNEKHRNDVINAINNTKPHSLLIIGTSESMIEKIIAALNSQPDLLFIPKIDEKIYIEDITTENEQKIAQKNRHQQGKHVIPVSSAQLKKDFSGYFLSSLHAFRHLSLLHKDEKSIVRPSYSYSGNFVIAPEVISDIISCVAEDVNGIKDVLKVSSFKHKDGIHIKIFIKTDDEYPAIEVAQELQKIACNTIEEMTAFNVNKLNIEIRSIV